MFCTGSGSPLPTFRSPQLAPLVAIIFNEILELAIAYGGLRDRKRGNLNFMCQSFVIEDEALFGSASESEFAAGDFCVAC